MASSTSTVFFLVDNFLPITDLFLNQVVSKKWQRRINSRITVQIAKRLRSMLTVNDFSVGGPLSQAALQMALIVHYTQMKRAFCNLKLFWCAELDRNDPDNVRAATAIFNKLARSLEARALQDDVLTPVWPATLHTVIQAYRQRHDALVPFLLDPDLNNSPPNIDLSWGRDEIRVGYKTLLSGPLLQDQQRFRDTLGGFVQPFQTTRRAHNITVFGYNTLQEFWGSTERSYTDNPLREQALVYNRDTYKQLRSTIAHPYVIEMLRRPAIWNMEVVTVVDNWTEEALCVAVVLPIPMLTPHSPTHRTSVYWVGSETPNTTWVRHSKTTGQTLQHDELAAGFQRTFGLEFESE